MEDEVHSDAGSAIVIEVESGNPVASTSPWTNHHTSLTETSSQHRPRTTRRKRKPMTSPQASHVSRRCNNCGVTKTPQWREGPDGPKTLCNACGVKYSRERQDKSKSRKSRKVKSKTGIKSRLSYSSVKKRTRNSVRDRQSYDFAFLFSSTANPSPMPKMAKVSTSKSIPGITGKEYTAALSLVSLAILGTPSAEAPPTYEDESDLAQPKTRRSKRIARRTCAHYYGGLDTDEWIPHLLDDTDEGNSVYHRGWATQQKSEDVAMGVPCVWAAMGYSDYQDPCCCCRKQGSSKKVTDSDMASSASDSAKSDFLHAHAKIHD